MKFVLFITFGFLVSACAKMPDQISAANIGPTSYAQNSCQQLAQEHKALSIQLENLNAKQRSAASGDAFGVFLIGLPLSSMSGNDQETQIGVMKARLQSIELAQTKKRCRSQ